MANFSNAKANLVGTTPVTLVDADVATVISGCSVANRHASTTSVSLYVENNSEVYYITKNRAIDGGHNFEAISGNKIFLQAGDVLKAVGSTPDSFDIILSVLDGI
jgi:hypothetical protein